MTAGFQRFELADLQEARAVHGRPYLEFLRRPGMSAGLYVLPAGGEDKQTPHDTDEIYVVLRGHAHLQVDGVRHRATEGDVLAVDRGLEHRFVDITEDLRVLVVFAPPEES